MCVSLEISSQYLSHAPKSNNLFPSLAEAKRCGDAGIWTRGLSHAKRTLYHWATSPCILHRHRRPVQAPISLVSNSQMISISCSKNIEIQNEIKKALLRFELRISCLLDRRFNQLSHRAISASRWSINKYSWHSWPFLVHLSLHNTIIYVQNESKNPTTTRLELAIFWSEVRRLIH